MAGAAVGAVVLIAGQLAGGWRHPDRHAAPAVHTVLITHGPAAAPAPGHEVSRTEPTFALLSAHDL
jgi:hypothetical protein